MLTQKSLKILIVCVCAIALTLAVSSCKKDSGEPAEQPTTPETKVPTTPETTPTTPDTTEKVDIPKPPEPPKAGDDRLLVVPLVGLGPVRFGMSKEQVIDYLGEPDRMEAGGMGMQYLSSKGISLMIDLSRGVRGIDCWSKQYPYAPPEISTFAGKTKEGIAMGAGREQIVAAYGKPDRTVPRGDLETLLYDKLQAQFTLNQNKLVNMRIRAPR